MPEAGSVIGFEITELLQESRDLHNDAEDMLIRGMVVHDEDLHRLIVLDHWIESLLLQLLPISTQLVFAVRTEQQQEILHIRDNLFQLEIALCHK